MSREPKTASLGLRVPPSMKADLEAWASAEGRTLASLIHFILSSALRAKQSRPRREQENA